jgi:hypothetical protein
MTKAQFVDQFLKYFEEGFSERNASEIQNQNLQSLLVNIMRDVIMYNPKNLVFQSDEYDYLRIKKKQEREQIAFRSAYLFETLYFRDKNIIHFFKDDFSQFISEVINESAKRHFGKILTDILKNNLLSFSKDDYELLAQTVVTWAVAPHTRVAVQIWAYEILILLREKANISEETIGYLFEIFAKDCSPAMKCRLRKWKKFDVLSY